MPWIYRTVTGDIGPIDDGKLKELAALGEITETTQIQRVGMNHFVDASSVKGLVFPVVIPPPQPVAEPVAPPPKKKKAKWEKANYFDPYFTPTLLIALWWIAIVLSIIVCVGCILRMVYGEPPETSVIGIFVAIIWLFIARVAIEGVAVIFEICNHLRHIRDKE